MRGQWIPFDADALSQFLGYPLVLEEGQECEYGHRKRKRKRKRKKDVHDGHRKRKKKDAHNDNNKKRKKKDDMTAMQTLCGVFLG